MNETITSTVRNIRRVPLGELAGGGAPPADGAFNSSI
jgi:hypothetical protein